MTITCFDAIVKRSKELNLTNAAWASSMEAYSAKPYSSFHCFVGRPRGELFARPSLAPRFASPVGRCNFGTLLCGGVVSLSGDEPGLFSLETPLTSSSSDTDGSSLVEAGIERLGCQVRRRCRQHWKLQSERRLGDLQAVSTMPNETV